MANTLPLNIPVPASASIASFNYTDIAEGTGVVKFYGASRNANGTTDYFLTTSPVYSDDIILSGAIPTGNFDRVLAKSYDVKFNRPQNLKGIAYLNLSIGASVGTARDGDTKIFVSGAILKISGATAITDITTAVSGAVLLFPTVNHYDRSCLIPLAINGTKHIKGGETLRLYAELWGQAGAAGTLQHVGWGNDPAGRDDPAAGVTYAATLSGANVTSKFELYVPTLLNNT